MSTKPVHRFRHVVFVLALLFCLLLSVPAVRSPVQAAPMRTAGQPACVAKLKPLLLAKMQQLRIPGTIIFVDDPGQCSWTTALGLGNLATREPMRVNDYMRIGSLTKTLTGTVILRLVDQHKLGLDDPIGKYQPNVPDGNAITIRQLLNMSSGLFNYSEDEGFVQALLADPYKVWAPQALVAIAFKHPPYFAPGQGFHYSNTNTLLLGLLIEQLTGMAVEKAFQQNIFRPLGMHESLLPPLSSTAIPNPHAQGYMYGTDFTGKGPTLNVTDWNPSWGWAAGAAISTLHDLQIWAKALATGRLLSAATQEQRLSWVTCAPIWLGKPQCYGLAVADHGGFIGHTGTLPGFQSFMGYQPQKGATIIVLVNLNVAANDAEDSGPTKEPANELAKVIQQELFA